MLFRSHLIAAVGGSDCDDTDPSIHVGAEDVWYDGVDSDCSGGSDFDADGDGHDMGDAPGEDCDDSDATIFPGAEDLYYDGVDSDCAGDSDMDSDGDGFDLGPADCDDTDAAIYAGAPETWYDGIDSDCGGEDDFDQDADGFVRDVDVGKGTYPVSMTAAIAAFRAKNPPHIVQVYEVGTATMMAAKGAIVPVAKVMKEGKVGFDPKAYLPTVTGYYTDLKGNMLSLPFNS